MKFHKLARLGLALFFTSMGYAQKTPGPRFGNGILNIIGKDSTWSMDVGLRFQFLSTFQWQDNASMQSNFSIRRSRLKFDGFALSPKLRYKVELGLSNRDMSGTSEFTGNSPRYLLDAVVMWHPIKNVEIWAGQTKLPGNIERVISSGNLQQVDRSLLNRYFTIDRDIGLQLRHEMFVGPTFLIREKLAISQGEGRNIVTGNLGGHQFTGRLEILPFGAFKGEYLGSDLEREPHPKLMLSATFDSNQDAVKTRSNQGDYMETDSGFYETTINTLLADLMFKYRGFSLMGEYALRNADDPIAKNSDGTETGDVVQEGSGSNLQAGYLFDNNWEVSMRQTHISWDDEAVGNGDETQYTFGISKYLVGHKLKVQTDLSYLSVDNEEDELMYRLQFEIHF
ncbi:MAG: porin [Sediminicola sp.]|tara:strand:+ start:9944 stop:11131 length:1188 start_codon:yes stop_codon:yes gene_type:complete